MTIINLTDRPVDVPVGPTTTITIPNDGTVARVEYRDGVCEHQPTAGGVPMRSVYKIPDRVAGLPRPTEGVLFIVPDDVRRFLFDTRKDLLSVTKTPSGQVLGLIGSRMSRT